MPAFPQLRLSGELAKIADMIDVDRVTFSKGEKRLVINVSSHQVIEKKHIYKLEEMVRGLYREMPNLKVSLRERFRLSRQYTKESFYDVYESSIACELERMNPCLKSIFNI